MMVLVIGGSGSGKSAYAEELVAALSKNNVKRYYLATMRILDEEGRKKVERHRKIRAGKGFLTIEQPTGISGALKKMEAGDKTVLLECISNLVANEMFSGREAKREIQVAENILRDIKLLKEQTMHLIVVSSNVFEDGITYDESTMEYIRAIGKINRKLAAVAERVVEVAAGIPIIIK